MENQTKSNQTVSPGKPATHPLLNDPGSWKNKKFIHQAYNLSIMQIAGIVLLLIGMLTLITIGIYECSANGGQSVSSLIAIGFFIIMLGILFVFPDMIKSGKTDETSTMRVVTYMIVSVFVFMCVKLGWDCKTFKDFQIDRTWAYILGIALGSKAAQTFGEGKTVDPGVGIPAGQSPNPGLNPGPSTQSGGLIHGATDFSVSPPSTRPSNIK
jgi:hypothetical protein